MSTPVALDPSKFLFGTGGAPAVKFVNVGDTTTGVITVEPEVRDCMVFGSDEIDRWPNGDSKKQLVVTVSTDAGEQRFFIKGKSMTAAVAEAVRAAGQTGLSVGATLTIQYTGNGVASRPGIHPPKLFSASYAPPAPAAVAVPAGPPIVPAPKAATPAGPPVAVNPADAALAALA